jgi:N-acyl-L-homoserine lactone synthetase
MRNHDLDLSLSPARRRLLDRIKNSPELALSAILTEMNGRQHIATVIDFSSRGFRLKVAGLKPELTAQNIEIRFGKRIVGHVIFPRLLWSIPDQGICAFSFETDKAPSARTKRSTSRISIEQEGPLSLQLVSEDPLFASQEIFFRLREIDSKGLAVTTSLRNKHLLPGSVLEKCRFLYPGFHQFDFKVVIRHVQMEDNKMKLGLELLQPTSEVIDACSQLGILYQAKAKSMAFKDQVDVLERAGLSRKKIAKSAVVEVISTEESYDQILDLRWKAYKAAGKLKVTASREEMKDAFDQQSTILGLRIAGKIVATVRVVRARTPDERFPFEDYVQKDPPFTTDQRLASCELSRMAVDPDVHGTDLPSGLVKRMLEFGLRGGCSRGYCIATTSLQKIYERIGWKVVSAPFPHPVLHNETMRLMEINPQKMALGSGIPALVWDSLYKEASLFLHSSGLVKKIPVKGLKDFQAAAERNLLSLKKKLSKPRK